jgi:NitT/TauT family transport system permease protein
MRRVRRGAMFIASLVLLVVAWEVYKAVGPENGGKVFGSRILPRTDERSMPHFSDMVSRLFDPAQRGSSERNWQVVAEATWFSFRLSLTGFVIGVVAGLGLAVAMTRFKPVERALLPYLVLSQTVPLIALAPLVAQWGGQVHIGGWEWPRWMSVAVLGAFLSFFPVAVGGLRGLSSPEPAALELMDSLAAPWHQTLWKLRFPAAVPFLIPALKLAAAASVIGVVVAEISTTLKGGLGRLIIEYARQATSDPAIVYTALFGTAVLGLAMAGLVAALDVLMMRNRPKEATT